MIPQRPNVLYIHTDQHSPDVLGSYGDQVISTPHLDRLAGSGARFGNAYCASPICVASRMSMLTGLHPFQNEVWSNNHVLSSGIPTLAHSLGAAGYRPVIAGRMHSVGPDQWRGYLDRYVGDHNPNYPGARGPGRGQLEGAAGPSRESIDRSGIGQSGYEVHDEVVTDSALAYLQRWRDERPRDHDDPFCLTVGYMLPHAPFVAREADFRRYEGRVGLPEIREPASTVTHPFHRWWRRRGGIEEITDAEILRCRTAYYALVDRVDRQIGRLLAFLDDEELTRETLVVYTSDHGEMAGQHDLFWKHVFYESSARVPLIVSQPGVIPEGSVVDNVVSALDGTASLLDAVGAPALPDSPGRSFMPHLRGVRDWSAWDDVAFSEYCNDEAFSPEGGCYHRMIRRGPWKLIDYDGQPCQLFNLEDDPEELRDRAGDPELSETRERLLADVRCNWNAASVRDRMELLRRRNQVLHDWAAETDPPQSCRWEMTGDMNILSSESGHRETPR